MIFRPKKKDCWFPLTLPGQFYSAWSINFIVIFSRKQYFWSQPCHFLAHLAFRPSELLSSLFVCRPSVNISHFNLLLRNHWANCNQTLVEWFVDGPLPICVRWSRLPTKMATKLKIGKRGDEILIVHCY
jgi:hypothetical protein